MKNSTSLRLTALLLCLLTGWFCRPGNGEIKSLQAAQPSRPTDSIPPPAADLDYLLGKFDPAGRADFVAVESPYTAKSGMMLRKETFEAFQNMYAAALQEGIQLKIISATRTFTQQKGIWEEKWSRFARETPGTSARALKILEYSAMPGASRHHWGTDVDLNDLNNRSFEAGGPYAKTYAWLRAHAHEYGFCQPYTAKDANRPQGYNEERWHWSYIPLAKPFLYQYLKTVTDSVLTGFKGSETALKIRTVALYAAGINPDCK